MSSSRAVKDDSSDPDDVCDDPEIVKLMIEYFYHFDYLLSPDLEPEPEPELKAEPIQPQEDDLGWFLIERKKERKDKGIPSDLPKIFLIKHANVFAMAVKYQVDELRDLAVTKFEEAVRISWVHEDFTHTIFVVHSSPAEDVHQLQDIVSNTIHEDYKNLKDKAEVEALMCSIPTLAYGLLTRSREDNDLVRATCVRGSGG